MNVLQEAIRLITQPPGDLVYFLVTLFALQQAVFPALTTRRRTSQAALPRRWLWAIGGMLSGRVVMMVIGLLGTVGLLNPAQILPPLERWLEFASVLLVMWATLCGARPARWQTVMMLILLTASLVLYGVTAALWPAWEAAYQAFNGWLFEQIWEVLTLTLLLLYLALTVLVRPPEWEWMVALCVFWLLGHTAQLRWPDLQMHFSGWLRLTSLVTLPALAVLAQRQMVSPVVTPPSKGIHLDAEALQDVLQGVEAARDLDPALIIASSKLANLLAVDMCAIALNTDGDPPVLKVVALHPPNAAQIEAPSLSLADYPLLAEAYTQQHAHVVKPTAQTLWLTALYNKLGIQKVAPLSVVPLAHKDESLGLLLLANLEHRQPWSEESLNLQQLVATLFATSVARARKQTQDLSFLSRLRGQDTERQKLESALEEARTEAQTLQSRLAALTQELQAREKEILQLNQELAAQSPGLSETEINFWQEEVQELVKEREALQNQVQALTRDREVLLHEESLLADKLANLKTEMEALTETHALLQTECATLQEKLDAAERALADAKKTANGATVGLLVTNAYGQITMADAVARRLLHLPHGDVTGFPINGVYPDPRWTQTVDALLVRDVPNGLKRAHLTLTVEQVTIEADLVTLVGRDGQPDGLAITLRTPESEAERQEAIVGLANELRTPMTSITGYTDLLLGEQAGILTEMQQQFLERVKANIEQMNHLLNDLVRTASPDSRPVELSPQAVNLIEIIEEAVMGLAARFRERKLAVRLDLPPELPPVRADRDSLYQILLRLISNAALCSREGTEVVINAREDDAAKAGKFVRIAVRDTGGGIAPEDYPRVFRRFYRATQPLVQGMGETGVGMAVAKTLVEANGGRIWVESQLNVGSTFNFILPTETKKTRV